MIGNLNGYRISLNKKLEEDLKKGKRGEELEGLLREKGFGKWFTFGESDVLEKLFQDLERKYVLKGEILGIKYSTDKWRDLEFQNGKTLFCIYADDKTKTKSIELVMKFLESDSIYDPITYFEWKDEAENIDIQRWVEGRHTRVLDKKV